MLSLHYNYFYERKGSESGLKPDTPQSPSVQTDEAKKIESSPQLQSQPASSALERTESIKSQPSETTNPRDTPTIPTTPSSNSSQLDLFQLDYLKMNSNHLRLFRRATSISSLSKMGLFGACRL